MRRQASRSRPTMNEEPRDDHPTVDRGSARWRRRGGRHRRLAGGASAAARAAAGGAVPGDHHRPGQRTGGRAPRLRRGLPAQPVAPDPGVRRCARIVAYGARVRGATRRARRRGPLRGRSRRARLLRTDCARREGPVNRVHHRPDLFPPGQRPRRSRRTRGAGSPPTSRSSARRASSRGSTRRAHGSASNSICHGGGLR